ncbi:MAG: diguanylate cyclase, partial [Chlamydiota bacterium]|nr:diguanylate cyclase [Chlamydiota bacterium]
MSGKKDLKKVSILIVEDDLDYSSLLQGILSLETNPTYDIFCADSLKSSIDIVHKQKIDLVLLDLSLPDSSGIHTFTSIYSQVPTIPIVVLSGMIDEDLALEAVRKGAQDYLVKGQVEGRLLSRVMRYSIERMKSEAERNAYLYLLDVIRHIQLAYIKDTGSKSLFDEAVRYVLEFAKCDLGFIGEIQFDKGLGKHQFQCFAFQSPRLKDEDGRFAKLDSVERMALYDLSRHVDKVMHAGKKVLIDEFKSDHVKVAESGVSCHLENFIGIPLYHGPELIGIFGLANRKKGFNNGFSEQIHPIMSTIVSILDAYRNSQHRDRAEAALRESEERYAIAATGSCDGLWDWNLRTDEIYYSPRWKSMLGFTEEQILNNTDEWLSRIHPMDLDKVKTDLGSYVDGLTPHFENEHRMLHADGTYRWVLTRGYAVRDSEGVAYRMAGSQSDVTDRRVAVEQLLHDAFHDALTGLPNRALFVDRLSRSIGHTKRRERYRFSVLLLDLDRFKLINESLGHTVGDQLLIGTARRLEACLRPGDTVARLGGDEFAILLDDIKDDNIATRIATHIHEELKLPFYLSGHEVFSNASIGITTSITGYERADDILRDADTALYRAKSLGKACYVVFEKGMHAGAVALLQLETDLRRALERNEIHVYYQPVISMKSGKTVLLEALVRWKHPERGLVMPDKFISVAEETGMIVPIGLYVLREACRQTREWQKQIDGELPISVSVNLSGKQFYQPDLVERICQICQETGMDPHH